MRVSVVGGGIIGLSIAWECLRRGHDVIVADPRPGQGASQVAAGMLAPVSEAYFGEQELTQLLLAAAASWPGFAQQLSSDTGIDVGYRAEGTLQIGLTADDNAELRRLQRHQESLGAETKRVAPHEYEPSLNPRARGVLVPGDHQVDPRRVLQALLRRVRVQPEPVAADITVLAKGVATTEVPVRPVKGVLLRLSGAVRLAHVIRGYADGQPVYLVPRNDGEVLVGASSEETNEPRATAGVVRDLLRAATDLVPELAEHALAEVCVGQRPASPDNGPIVGRLQPGVLVATGHYRHGVLAAPLTAHAIADLIDGKPLPDVWSPFTPSRFPGGSP